MKAPALRNLVRIDSPGRSPGWRCRIKRRGEHFVQFFPDEDYAGGSEESLVAARAYRDQVVSALSLPWVQQLPDPKRGVVLLTKRVTNKQGRTYSYRWVKVTVPTSLHDEYSDAIELPVAYFHGEKKALAAGWRIRRGLVKEARDLFFRALRPAVRAVKRSDLS